MKFQKIWINNQPKEHTFILFHDNILYSQKVNKDNFYKTEKELQQGIISNKFFSLPIPYINAIEFREDFPKLQIYFNQESEAEIDISNPKLRKEIFDYLKEHTAVKSFKQAKPSIFKRIKKPLIGLLLIFGMLSFVYSMQDYVVVGKPGRGLISVVLALANLGLLVNLLIFSPFIALLSYRLVKNYQNDSEIHRLVYRK